LVEKARITRYRLIKRGIRNRDGSYGTCKRALFCLLVLIVRRDETLVKEKRRLLTEPPPKWYQN